MYWDTVLPCFGVRVSSAGRKTFIVMQGRNRQRTTIGTYPTLKLQDARAAAKRILATRTLNKHLPQSVPFADALTEYLAACKEKNRPITVREYKRTLNKHWLPGFRHVQLSDISPQDVHRRLDRLADTPAEQRYALVSLKVLFSWCRKRHYIERSPAADISLAVGAPRERVLTDDELVKVWRAATSYPFGSIVRLLILTGMRRMEVAGLHWAEVEPTRIVLPPERTKNKREHVVPLTAFLTSALADVKKAHDSILFPAKGKDTPVNAWGQEKAAFDALAGIAPWTLHDLRRTFATNLAALNVAPHIVERLLNHKSGQISGVAAIYNRFDYFKECLTALEAWHKRLLGLISSAGS